MHARHLYCRESAWRLSPLNQRMDISELIRAQIHTSEVKQGNKLKHGLTAALCELDVSRSMPVFLLCLFYS